MFRWASSLEGVQGTGNQIFIREGPMTESLVELAFVQGVRKCPNSSEVGLSMPNDKYL